MSHLTACETRQFYLSDWVLKVVLVILSSGYKNYHIHRHLVKVAYCLGSVILITAKSDREYKQAIVIDLSNPSNCVQKQSDLALNRSCPTHYQMMYLY